MAPLHIVRDRVAQMFERELETVVVLNAAAFQSFYVPLPMGQETRQSFIAGTRSRVSPAQHQS
jgi:hypothetical protein